MSRKYQKVSETLPKQEYDKTNSGLNGCTCNRMNGGKLQLLHKSANYSFLIKYPTWPPKSNRKKGRRLIYKCTLFKGSLSNSNVCTSREQIVLVVNKGQRRPVESRPIKRGSTYLLKAVQQLTASVQQNALL